jgi:hypothetical protein
LNAQRNLHLKITALQPERSLQDAIKACCQLNFKGRRPLFKSRTRIGLWHNIRKRKLIRQLI